MKFHAPRMVLLSLFAFAAMGSASATPIKTSPAVFATQPATVEATAPMAANPWPTLAGQPPAALLARDDHKRYDNRWHARRDDRHRENWRRDQWRREAERRRHDRAMHQRYDNHHRDYRR